jgi:plastocyanin
MSACGDDDNNGTTDSADTTQAQSVTTEASSGGDTITLVATNFAFDKTTLTAAADKAVTFKITNNGTVEHNLTIDDLAVNKDVEAGESAEQTVTPKAGTYEYHCEYHPSQMKGELTVS